jgi:hypothetical protein
VRLRALALAALAALLLTPTASALTTFYGKVGPSSTIVLRRANGTVVKSASAGRKTFVIRDRSSAHNFHLSGPGVDRRTRITFVGKTRWTVTLSAGTYTYICDVHPSTMRRSFSVG